MACCACQSSGRSTQRFLLGAPITHSPILGAWHPQLWPSGPFAISKSSAGQACSPDRLSDNHFFARIHQHPSPSRRFPCSFLFFSDLHCFCCVQAALVCRFHSLISLLIDTMSPDVRLHAFSWLSRVVLLFTCLSNAFYIPGTS